MMSVFGISVIRETAERLLRTHGVEENDAAIVVDHMITADQWGRPTHGLSVRYPHVLRFAEQGIGANRPEIVRDTGATITVDGNNGFGYLAGQLCTQILIERCQLHGLATVALCHTRHTGMLGYYVDMATRSGIVTFAFSHCGRIVAPFGAREALFGTNPLAIGFPAAGDPILIDMGTAATTYGEMLMHERDGTPMSEGVALGPDGVPTTDPILARKGALLPFGGHRGGALCLAVQLLAGAVTGTAVIPDMGVDYGMLLIGLRRDVFQTEAEYDTAIAEFLEIYRRVDSSDGKPLHVPGETRYRNRRQSGDTLKIDDALADILGLDAGTAGCRSS